MQQTIYCDCFFCEHHEGGKCVFPVLHLGHYTPCREFSLSDEKLEAWLISHRFPDSKKKFYDHPPKEKLLRQKK